VRHDPGRLGPLRVHPGSADSRRVDRDQSVAFRVHWCSGDARPPVLGHVQGESLLDLATDPQPRCFCRRSCELGTSQDRSSISGTYFRNREDGGGPHPVSCLRRRESGRPLPDVPDRESLPCRREELPDPCAAQILWLKDPVSVTSRDRGGQFSHVAWGSVFTRCRQVKPRTSTDSVRGSRLARDRAGVGVRLPQGVYASWA
jgi:hypothetical protein